MNATAHSTTSARPNAGPRMTADDRRASVIEAAVQAFGAGGLDGTSTEEIARLAGVSQPYLFRLFGSKQELFLAAVGRAFERIRLAFEDAANHPIENPAGGYHPVLAAMGMAYGELLADRALLRLQLHAFAACDDPTVRTFVRRAFADLIARVATLSGVSDLQLRAFFAEGMLLNAAAAMDLSDAEAAWGAICAGGQC